MSQSVLEMPFTIGTQMWIPKTSSEQVTVPCPVCAGRCVVVVILGEDERVPVACEACGLGFNGSRGTITEWDLTPSAAQFVIASVDSMRDGEWTVRSDTGASTEYKHLCATEADALAVSAQRCAAQHEQNMLSRQRKRKDVKRATWTVQYHRTCITDLERQLAWHRSRITAKGKP